MDTHAAKIFVQTQTPKRRKVPAGAPRTVLEYLVHDDPNASRSAR